jgi:poly(hydroxyalkanoate) granule-associated protein
MSKSTEKTTKTTKNAKTTKKSTAKAEQTKSFSFINTAQAPIELFKNVATKSIYFSLGLGAYLFDGRQNLENLQKVKFSSLRSDLTGNVNKFINNTIHKGEKLEKDAAETVKHFEEAQRNRVKQLFTTPKPKIQKAETSLEDKIEEVIATLDLPTRDELHKLNHRLAELTREIQRQRNTSSSRKPKTTKTEVKETKAKAKAKAEVEETANA